MKIPSRFNIDSYMICSRSMKQKNLMVFSTISFWNFPNFTPDYYYDYS